MWTTWNDREGNLWSCGLNQDGQLGLNNNANRNILTRVSSDTAFEAVSCGDNHTMAIDINGNLWGCGSNWYGEIGLSDTIERKLAL